MRPAERLFKRPGGLLLHVRHEWGVDVQGGALGTVLARSGLSSLPDSNGEPTQLVSGNQVVPAYGRFALDAQVLEREQSPQEGVSLL
jgi:hypothetical protein